MVKITFANRATTNAASATVPVKTSVSRVIQCLSSTKTTACLIVSMVSILNHQETVFLAIKVVKPAQTINKTAAKPANQDTIT